MEKLFLILIIIIQGCNWGLKPHQTESPKYISQNVPFTIVNENQLLFPKHIDNRVKSGKVIFHYFIEADGGLKGINIALLILYSEEGKQIERITESSILPVQKESYPDEILPYYDFLLQYAKESKVIKTGELDPEAKYLFRLPKRISRPF